MGKLFLTILLIIPLMVCGQEKKEIHCFWMGSSSSPKRLCNAFDGFVNAGKGFSIKESVRGATVRLDRLAMPENKEKPLSFKGVNKGDYVVIQISTGFTRDQVALDGMGRIVGEFCKQIRDLGAEPVLWESYAAQEDKVSAMGVEQRQALLHGELLKVAAKNNALFVPAGSAWQEVRFAHKEDEMFMFSAIPPRDVGHTGPRGNYILGAAIYAAITGENPMDNPNDNSYEMDASLEKVGRWASCVPFPLDPKETKIFKEVVWKHELKAREEYAALGGKFVHPQMSGSASVAPALAPSTNAALPKKESLDIYLVMGRRAVIAAPGSFKGDAKGVFVKDAKTGDWRSYQAGTDGDGGLGAALLAKSSGKSVGLIFCGVEGSSLDDWGQNKKCYNQAMTLAQDALRQGSLKACLWVSAPRENDAKNPAYLKMLGAFREEVPAPELPFLTPAEAGINL